MGGDKNFRNGSRLSPTEIVGNLRQQPLVNDYILRLAAASNQTENPLSGLPHLDQRTDLGHLARKFQSGNFLRKSWGRRILPLPLQQISAVQGRGDRKSTRLNS